MGRMLPAKLGVRHGDLIVASSSLPAYIKLNELVPRRLSASWNGSLLAGVASGTLARMVEPPLQSCSGRTASRQGCPGVSAPLVVTRSSGGRRVRLVIATAMELSIQIRRLSLGSRAFSRVSSGIENVPCNATLAS